MLAVRLDIETERRLEALAARTGRPFDVHAAHGTDIVLPDRHRLLRRQCLVVSSASGQQQAQQHEAADPAGVPAQQRRRTMHHRPHTSFRRNTRSATQNGTTIQASMTRYSTAGR